jgi:hypothetical protein
MRSHGFRRSFGKLRLLAFASLIVLFAVWFVPLASAHNSLITVSLACNGTASYTATAWNGPTTASRTDSDVRVFSSTDNGTTWTQVGTGQFNQADHFSFSGTFSVGSSNSVRMRVQEFADWGDGTKPAPPGTAQANGPSNCTTTTTPTTTTQPTTTTTTTPTTTTQPTTTTTTTTQPTTPTQPTTTTTPPAATTTPTTTTPTTPSTPPPPPVAPHSPAISLVKTERVGTAAYGRGPISATAGQTIDYRMVVSNTGDVTLTVKLTDLRCDSGTLHAGADTTLAPGESLTYTCTHRLDSSDMSPFVNRATATGVTPAGANVGPVSSEVAVKQAGGVVGAFKPPTIPKVKKVTAKAKPAKAVVAPAHFTG